MPNAFFLPAQKLQTLSYVSAARTKRRLSEKPSLKSSSSTPLLLIEFSPFYHRRPLFVNPSAQKKSKVCDLHIRAGKKAMFVDIFTKRWYDIYGKISPSAYYVN
ncbi:MAG: hypothetical protein MRZ96_00620 [Clostridium sp.]|nr:hypothetical protein [Clostridium sp.]